jgi:hypothetical protein
MSIELKQHFVAFLDVLGFSEMVKADTISDSQTHLSKLFKCHQSAAQIFRNDPLCSITQFSDSIVISRPYEASAFKDFVIHVAEYQRLLLNEELLCRGGIAVNKHFSNGSFTFSAGLIDAYRIESKAARYPRVVISQQLLLLLFPEKIELPPFLIKEDDGLLFIDYVGLTMRKKPKKLTESINNLVSKLLENKDSSVKEKGLWLAAYSDAILGTSLKKPKFEGTRVK